MIYHCSLELDQNRASFLVMMSMMEKMIMLMLVIMAMVIMVNVIMITMMTMLFMMIIMLRNWSLATIITYNHQNANIGSQRIRF